MSFTSSEIKVLKHFILLNEIIYWSPVLWTFSISSKKINYPAASVRDILKELFSVSPQGAWNKTQRSRIASLPVRLGFAVHLRCSYGVSVSYAKASRRVFRDPCLLCPCPNDLCQAGFRQARVRLNNFYSFPTLKIIVSLI